MKKRGHILFFKAPQAPQLHASCILLADGLENRLVGVVQSAAAITVKGELRVANFIDNFLILWGGWVCG